jgi:hypothetical protein
MGTFPPPEHSKSMTSSRGRQVCCSRDGKRSHFRSRDNGIVGQIHAGAHRRTTTEE